LKEILVPCEVEKLKPEVAFFSLHQDVKRYGSDYFLFKKILKLFYFIFKKLFLI